MMVYTDSLSPGKGYFEKKRLNSSVSIELLKLVYHVTDFQTMFLSPKYWDSSVNFEYRTTSVQYDGVDIFDKQNLILKIKALIDLDYP